MLYETFTVNQRQLGFGPTSPDHLLQPGELRQLFEGFDVLFYEEVLAPEAVARIVARRPASRLTPDRYVQVRLSRTVVTSRSSNQRLLARE